VGVNDFIAEEEPINILLIDESVTGRQIQKLRRIRETRDNGEVRRALVSLHKTALDGGVNMMPYIIDCVRGYATLGEICDELRSIYGIYEEPSF
jgi:methylmalonyl-CoA mutase, N-terminal domain